MNFQVLLHFYYQIFLDVANFDGKFSILFKFAKVVFNVVFVSFYMRSFQGIPDIRNQIFAIFKNSDLDKRLYELCFTLKGM